MRLSGLLAAVLMALASLLPHGAAAAAPPRAEAAQHHHQQPAPADRDDANCAAQCIGCSVASTLPRAERRDTAVRRIAHDAIVAAPPAGVAIGFDPPPPRPLA